MPTPTPTPVPGDAKVVVRNRWFLRWTAPFFGVFAVGLWYAVGTLWLGRLDGFSRVGSVLFGLFLLVPAVTSTIAAVVGPLLKETFTPTRITGRIIRSHTIDLGTATRIREVRAAVRTGRRVIPVGRLQIVGDDRNGPPMRCFLDPSLTHFDEAMDILDGWVRKRPELVADDPRATEVFTARGVLKP